MPEFLSHLGAGPMWGIFGAIVVTILFLDLFVFHRHADKPSMRSTLTLCLSYMSIALLFGLFIMYERGLDTGMDYYTGYLVEFSLSLDNIFVMSLVFTSLKIPDIYQHRVLFWGILGAVIMRAIMILLGEQLVSQFHGVLYLFSAFLIYTGVKMLIHRNDVEDPSEKENKVMNFVKKHLRMTNKLNGEHFTIRKNGQLLFTPLFMALLTIELMDVIFAIDSIPAIFLITTDVFVVYTSNIFAILGLRSLYFLLAAAVSKFTYLKHALSIVLIFIGLKIYLPLFDMKVSNVMSLVVTFTLLAGGVALSLYKNKQVKAN